MPFNFGSLIREVDVNISEIWETNILFLLSIEPNARILSVKDSSDSIWRVELQNSLRPLSTMFLIFFSRKSQRKDLVL